MSDLGTVSVTAQWARWGMDPGQPAGYHLLACSRGRIGPRNFEEILARFSPGSLDTLPQVTVSFVRGEAADSRYLGMSIHEEELGGRDRLGRDVTVTRYFCLPYQEVASGALSYLAMYEALRDLRVPAAGGSPHRVELAGTQAEAAVDLERTGPVAALLLTGNAVCIVGAGSVSMADRLIFIDRVMSLLPYGMRAEMTAATWASSVYRHKFRLFFSDVPRAARPGSHEDHVISWRPGAFRIDQAKDTRISPEIGTRYQRWLRSRPPDSVGAELSRQSEPVPFAPAAVLRMVEETQSHGQSQQPGEAGHAEVDAPVPPVERGTPPAQKSTLVSALLGRREPSVLDDDPVDRTEVLLVGCLRAIVKESAPGLSLAVTQLEDLLRAAESHGDQDQQPGHGLIPRNARFARSLGLGRPRAALYEFLPRVAATGAISYHAYCLAEEIIGRRPHQALLRAIGRMAAEDPGLDLIVARYLDGPYPRYALRELVELALDPDFRPAHARVLRDRLIQVLTEASASEVSDARVLLAEHGYLAWVLATREPEDLTYQVETLTDLLTAVAGGQLAGADWPGILAGGDRPGPTIALLLAVLRLTDPAEADEVVRHFVAGLQRSVALDDYVRSMLASRGFAIRAREDPAHRPSLMTLADFVELCARNAR